MRCAKCGGSTHTLFPVIIYEYDKYKETRNGGDGDMSEQLNVCASCFKELLDNE